MRFLTASPRSDTTDELLTVTGLFAHFFSLDTTIKERQFFRRFVAETETQTVYALTLILFPASPN